MKNPYEKIYHRAALIGPKGQVSALCFDTPRAINLKRALWTLIDEAVTCKECRKRIKAKAGRTEVANGDSKSEGT